MVEKINMKRLSKELNIEKLFKTLFRNFKVEMTKGKHNAYNKGKTPQKAKVKLRKVAGKKRRK